MKFGRIGVCDYFNKGITFGTNGTSKHEFCVKTFMNSRSVALTNSLLYHISIIYIYGKLYK